METNVTFEQAIRSATQLSENRKTLSCATAFQIAEKYGVPVHEIGKFCNEQGIKIVHCQLGCFK